MEKIIDAAINGEGRYAGKAYFFKGDQYLRYDWNSDSMDSGYPLPIAGNWPGLVYYVIPGIQGLGLQPRLSLWQDLDPSSYPVQERDNKRKERLGFLNQASVQAVRMGSCAYIKYNYPGAISPIGPSPYRTGADIIDAIEAVYKQTGNRKIEAVHIFCHSSVDGIFCADHSEKNGLYKSEFANYLAQNGWTDGCVTSNLPCNKLANNVVFVLHGCDLATLRVGKTSFAKDLFDHLQNHPLTNAQVFGHFGKPGCGPNKDWRWFHNINNEGRRNDGQKINTVNVNIYREMTTVEERAVNTVNYHVYNNRP
jgi:hypothetical protein